MPRICKIVWAVTLASTDFNHISLSGPFEYENEALCITKGRLNVTIERLAFLPHERGGPRFKSHLQDLLYGLSFLAFFLGSTRLGWYGFLQYSSRSLFTSYSNIGRSII
jgi:hypothetical protein